MLVWTVNSVEISIEDNGKGIPDIKTDAFGITGMLERAKILGGTLEIKNRIHGGTGIYLVIPKQVWNMTDINKITVILADDHPLLRRGVKNELESFDDITR